VDLEHEGVEVDPAFFGKHWKKLKDYDFHWGHRVIVDQNNPKKVFLTTFGSSVWYGTPIVE
jgi:hypothetical protein